MSEPAPSQPQAPLDLNAHSYPVFDFVRVAQLYDVPPWLVGGGPPAPRFARLRWRLRRWFPGLVWR